MIFFRGRAEKVVGIRGFFFGVGVIFKRLDLFWGRGGAGREVG